MNAFPNIDELREELAKVKETLKALCLAQQDFCSRAMVSAASRKKRANLQHSAPVSPRFCCGAIFATSGLLGIILQIPRAIADDKSAGHCLDNDLDDFRCATEWGGRERRIATLERKLCALS
jgi:hypothetical protein